MKIIFFLIVIIFIQFIFFLLILINSVLAACYGTNSCDCFECSFINCGTSGTDYCRYCCEQFGIVCIETECTNMNDVICASCSAEVYNCGCSLTSSTTSTSTTSSTTTSTSTTSSTTSTSTTSSTTTTVPIGIYYYYNSTNSTVANQPISHNLYWTANNSLSGYIFSFINGTNSTIVYNFSDTTNNKAWNNSVADEPPTTLTNSSETEFSSGAYTNISTSDNNYFETNLTSHPYHKFNITINESISDIKHINVSWEGHTTSSGTVNLYVYNFTAGNWGSSLASNSSTSDFWLNKSFTSGFNDFIQNGKMSILVQDPISRIQGNARATGTSKTSIVVSQNSIPVNGNVNVFVISTFANGPGATYLNVSSITQTGVTWTKQKKQTKSSAGSLHNVEIWFGVVGASASANITVNFVGGAMIGSNTEVVDICEYSGVLTTGFLDKTASNSGTGLATDTGTTDITTQADELWIGGITTSGASQSSPTNGFTLLDGNANINCATGYLEKIVNSTGTANSGTTCINSNWAGVITTFKATPDTAKPTYSLNSTNSTVANTLILHSLNWTDNVDMSGYIFSFDNCTGTLSNDTWTTFTSVHWSNVTKKINSTIGCSIKWCIYANDTSNNWNGTSCTTPFSYITTIPPPTYSLISTDYIEVKVRGKDWVNDTWTSMTGTGNWSNVTKIANSIVGKTIYWCVYANDTVNTWNGTSCVNPFSYIITANQPPRWSNNQSSIGYVNQYSFFNITWVDDTVFSISLFNLTFNGLSNKTMTNSYGGNIYNYSVNITDSGNYTWLSYGNDTSNLQNMTDSWTFEVISTTTTSTTTSTTTTIQPTVKTLFECERKICYENLKLVPKIIKIVECDLEEEYPYFLIFSDTKDLLWEIVCEN